MKPQPIDFKLALALALATLTLSISGLAIPNSANAAGSTPSLTTILPRGVQRGGEHTLKFVGDRIGDAEEVFLYHDGVTVKSVKPIDDKNVSVTIVVDPDCRLGEHVCQIRTRNGISDFRSFFVGALSEAAEAEPNNSLQEAQPIKLDVTVSGTVTNEDIDFFQIDGKKGQRISVEVEAIRLGFMFDPSIALLDHNRFEIATSDDSPLTKQDGFLSVLLPADGEYYISVRETAFRGSSACRYRLHVGQFPRPVAIFPPGAAPGETVKLKFIDSIAGEDGTPLSYEQEITLPTEEHFSGGLFFADEKGISPSPIPFRLSTLTNINESEPNNTWPKTPALEFPIAINGIIEAPGDRDYFKFHSKKGQVWHVQCYARRIGSGLDPFINIFGADKKNIIGNDDQAGKDSYLRFQAPADGDYYLRVRDHLNRGQADFVYRIEIDAPSPELTLGIKRVDRYSQQRQTIAVPQGSRFSVLVNATRKDFAGEIELLKENLPAGITMTAPPMKANLNLMPVVFEAASDAKIGGTLVDFKGRHIDPEKKIAGAFKNRADFVLGQPNNAVYYSSTVDKLAMAVIEPLPFKLEIVQPKVPLIRGGSMKIKIVAHRNEGYDQPIRLQFPFRPPGVGTTNQIVIPKGKSEIVYPINANDKAELGKWPMVVIGTAPFKGPAWTSTQMAELEIAEPFVKIEFERASCEVGKATKLYGKIEQLVPFEGEATVAILGIPPNVSINTPLKITKGSTEISFEVQTNGKSPVGKHASLFAQVTVTRNGEPIVGRAGAAVLQINKPKPKPKLKLKPKPKKANVSSHMEDVNED